MTDKELIKLYLEKKGVRKHAFCVSVGFSKNFLDNGDTITMVNLRKIINHPDYQDFNLAAFINQDGDQIYRDPQLLSEEVVNHEFIYDITMEMAKLKEGKDDLSPKDIDRLFEMLATVIKKYSSVSQEYTKLYNFIRREADL